MKHYASKGLLFDSRFMNKDDRSERGVNEPRFDATAYVQTRCIGLEGLRFSTQGTSDRLGRLTPDVLATAKSEAHASRPTLFTLKSIKLFS
jgi:hypothetical protein